MNTHTHTHKQTLILLVGAALVDLQAELNNVDDDPHKPPLPPQLTLP